MKSSKYAAIAALLVTAAAFSSQSAQAITLTGNATINVTGDFNFGTQTLAVVPGEEGAYYGSQIFDFNAGTGDLFTIRSTDTFCGWTCGSSPIVVTLSGLVFDTTLTSVSILTSIGGAVVQSFTQNSITFTWADASIPVGNYFTAQYNGGSVSSVPLPAALPLLAAGLAGLGGISMRRKRKSA